MIVVNLFEFDNFIASPNDIVISLVYMPFTDSINIKWFVEPVLLDIELMTIILQRIYKFYFDVYGVNVSNILFILNNLNSFSVALNPSFKSNPYFVNLFKSFNFKCNISGYHYEQDFINNETFNFQRASSPNDNDFKRIRLPIIPNIPLKQSRPESVASIAQDIVRQTETPLYDEHNLTFTKNVDLNETIDRDEADDSHESETEEDTSESDDSSGSESEKEEVVELFPIKPIDSSQPRDIIDAISETVPNINEMAVDENTQARYAPHRRIEDVLELDTTVSVVSYADKNIPGISGLGKNIQNINLSGPKRSLEDDDDYSDVRKKPKRPDEKISKVKKRKGSSMGSVDDVSGKRKKEKPKQDDFGQCQSISRKSKNKGGRTKTEKNDSKVEESGERRRPIDKRKMTPLDYEPIDEVSTKSGKNMVIKRRDEKTRLVEIATTRKNKKNAKICTTQAPDEDDEMSAFSNPMEIQERQSENSICTTSTDEQFRGNLNKIKYFKFKTLLEICNNLFRNPSTRIIPYDKKAFEDEFIKQTTTVPDTSIDPFARFRIYVTSEFAQMPSEDSFNMLAWDVYQYCFGSITRP